MTRTSAPAHTVDPAPTLRPWLGLVGWLGVTFAAALGSLAATDAGTFYLQLVHPAWAPSPSAFGPVWTVLYLLTGVAAWMVWRQEGWTAGRPALRLYLVQLGAHGVSTGLFFGWKGGAIAFVAILLWSALVLLTLLSFWRVRPLAGALLVPYLAWVAFASSLAYALWQLNPVVLG